MRPGAPAIIQTARPQKGANRHQQRDRRAEAFERGRLVAEGLIQPGLQVHRQAGVALSDANERIRQQRDTRPRDTQASGAPRDYGTRSASSAPSVTSVTSSATIA